MKKWHWAVVVALVIGLATGVYARGPGHGRMGEGPCGGMGPGFGGHGGSFGWMDSLDLTKAQADQLWQMREKHHTDTQALRYETFQKRLELRKLYADPKADEAIILAKEKELNAVHQKLHEKRVQLRIDERKVLTADQIKKLNEAPAGPGFGPRGPGGKGSAPGAKQGQKQG